MIVVVAVAVAAPVAVAVVAGWLLSMTTKRACS